VAAAVQTWSDVVPLTRVAEPERAHVLVFRKRPPLRQLASGWRASNGRSLLKLVEVLQPSLQQQPGWQQQPGLQQQPGWQKQPGLQQQPGWQKQPRVKVLVSPELRAAALQATALHELGHAFGLWAHSDQPDDAMAVSQGKSPVLELSARDKTTINWLRSQPTSFGLSP
ncbi:MAG: matrixin family metalloprotease, partial [Prochlorococcus sp.]|nr:matrixin family metalloprotease [Prochlorococcus sp.]